MLLGVGVGIGVAVGVGVRGKEWRKVCANREVRESRMQTARATVSRGREALVRINCIRGIDAGVREVEDGIRFVRCTAGPGLIHVLVITAAIGHGAILGRYSPRSSGSSVSPWKTESGEC